MRARRAALAAYLLWLGAGLAGSVVVLALRFPGYLFSSSWPAFSNIRLSVGFLPAYFVLLWLAAHLCAHMLKPRWLRGFGPAAIMLLGYAGAFLFLTPDAFAVRAVLALAAMLLAGSYFIVAELLYRLWGRQRNKGEKR